jgi:hypothetical protein
LKWIAGRVRQYTIATQCGTRYRAGTEDGFPLPESCLKFNWVPKKAYDKLVKVLVKKTKNSYARSALRRRMAAVGLSWDCKGSCSGGFCNEVQTQGGAYVCECSYYV